MPLLEPTEAPFHGVARRVPFRGVGLGAREPGPGRNDGLAVLLCQLGAEDVAVIGSVRDQAGQGRVGLGFHPGPDLGAVVALAPAPAQGTAPSIRQDVDLGAEAASAAAEDRLRLFLLGRACHARVRA